MSSMNINIVPSINFIMHPIEKLKAMTGKKNLQLTSRGNTAIFEALKLCSKERGNVVLIPDQGGWITYPRYPGRFNLNVVEVKTDLGRIDVDDLKKKVEEYDVNCLLYENPGGYFVDQPAREIFNACEANIILDVAGAIGDSERLLGQYADYVIGSFGRWKPVGLEHGGFIASNYDLPEPAEKFQKNMLEALSDKLDAATGNIKFFYDTCRQIKMDLSDMKIVHPDSDSLVVVVLADSIEDKNRVIDYCERNKYEYTLCPRYIRVMQDAVSIEVKRLKR